MVLSGLNGDMRHDRVCFSGCFRLEFRLNFSRLCRLLPIETSEKNWPLMPTGYEQKERNLPPVSADVRWGGEINCATRQNKVCEEARVTLGCLVNVSLKKEETCE